MYTKYTKLSRRRSWFAPAALVLALAVGACSDATDPEEEHADAAGLAAKINGVAVVTVNAARQVTGSFTVAAGDETDHVHVHFRDEDGDEIEIDESEYYLAVEVDNPTVAAIAQHEPGEFEVHIVGLAAGTTNLRFKLMHGQHPHGHSDYTSPNIPVTVTAAP